MMNAAADQSVNFGFGPIYHARLAEVPWTSPHTRKLPGIQPLDSNDWLRVDESFAAQMALRDYLSDEMPEKIMAQTPGAQKAMSELLRAVLRFVSKRPGYLVGPENVHRPDGVNVAINKPLETLLRLVVEDLCILEKQDEDYVMTAATLAFPGGWTLSEKIGRSMLRIHEPVDEFDDNISNRVGRLFDAIRPEQGLWRTNAFTRSSSNLFRPRKENDTYPPSEENSELLIRTERQCLIRLPETNAIVFSIHTRIAPMTALTPLQAKELAENPIEHEETAES